jgi:RecA-family ATPase
VPYIDDDDPDVRAAREQYEQTAKKKQNGSGHRVQSRALNWQQLIAIPKPTYIVKGIIEQGVLAEIYGPTQSGKSFLATDLALHIGFGWNWRGRRVRQGGVL